MLRAIDEKGKGSEDAKDCAGEWEAVDLDMLVGGVSNRCDGCMI